MTKEKDNSKVDVVLKELPDYVLYVGRGIENPDRGYAYLIENTKTNVVETETYILPQALEYITQLQAALDATRDMSSTDKKEPEGIKGIIPPGTYSH